MRAVEGKGYAWIRSGAPAMFDLMAVLILNRGEAVEKDEPIDGGDAVDRLAEFTTEVRKALQTISGALPPERAAVRPGLGIAELIRQHVLDLYPKPPRPPCLIPPRLLILARPGTKAAG